MVKLLLKSEDNNSLWAFYANFQYATVFETSYYEHISLLSFDTHSQMICPILTFDKLPSPHYFQLALTVYESPSYTQSVLKIFITNQIFSM